MLFAQTPSYPIKKINGVECIVYKVQPVEGFYRISKNFHTSEAVIREYNPQITDGLKAGMEIYIPVKQEHTAKKDYIEHVVEKKQTIFRIRKMYNITEDELIAINPHLKEKKLRTGEILKIPLSKKETKQEVEKKDDATRTVVEKKEVNQLVKQNLIENPKNKKTIGGENIKPNKPKNLNIAFLLPFMLDQKQESSDKRFIEFYSGSLLAIKEAKDNGINFNIHTYDVEKSDLKIMEVLQDSILTGMDLIVGPAYSNQVSVIGDFARLHKIKTLIPFSSKLLDLETNPYIYQFNPGLEVELQRLQELLQTEEKQTNVIFAELNHVSMGDDNYQLVRSLKQHMNEHNLPYQTILLNTDSLQHLRQTVDPLKENIIFFNTTRINNVSIYLYELQQLSSSVNIKIYEPYSWKNSKTEKPASFYLSVFKNEYPEAIYEKYSNNFSSLFDWTPSNELPRYDLLGYDLLQYFINHVLSSNNVPAVSYPFQEGIQSNLQFEKAAATGGYINKFLNHYE